MSGGVNTSDICVKGRACREENDVHHDEPIYVFKPAWGAMQEVRGELQRARTAQKTAEAMSLALMEKYNKAQQAAAQSEMFRVGMCEAGDHLEDLLKQKGELEAQIGAKDRIIREMDARLKGGDLDNSQSNTKDRIIRELDARLSESKAVAEEAVVRIASLEALIESTNSRVGDLQQSLSSRELELRAAVAHANEAQANAAESVARLQQAAAESISACCKTEMEVRILVTCGIQASLHPSVWLWRCECKSVGLSSV
jgi:chromosome segregation ATPase